MDKLDKAQQRELVRILVARLPGFPERRTVADECGLQDLEIPGDPKEAWEIIVSEANLVDRIERLVQSAADLSPGDSVLRGMADDARRQELVVAASGGGRGVGAVLGIVGGILALILVVAVFVYLFGNIAGNTGIPKKLPVRTEGHVPEERIEAAKPEPSPKHGIETRSGVRKEPAETEDTDGEDGVDEAPAASGS